MQIKSYAKVNLSLRVISKLKNGLHDIQSNIFLIDLFDKIIIKKNLKKKDSIFFKGKFKKNVSPKNNTVTKILRALREYSITKSFYDVSIKKNIPIFAGLGGGSSNAAFVAKYIKKGLVKNKNFRKIKKNLGTDFELFFFNRLYLNGLSKISIIRNRFKLDLILVYPKINCKTSEIYSKVKKFSKKNNFNYSKIRSKSKFINALKNEKNDLQRIVVNKYPKIKIILEYLSKQKGCYFSRITGSGSVCFGLFKSNKVAIKALKKIKKRFPKYWCVVTKTI
tara:strand:- start:235 stop:1071 length:837 start_codon:yes stop_codon:yes gene_type:complete